MAENIPNIPDEPSWPNMPSGAIPAKKMTGKVQPKKATQDMTGALPSTGHPTSQLMADNIPNEPGWPSMPSGAVPPKKETGKVLSKKATQDVTGALPKPSSQLMADNALASLPNLPTGAEPAKTVTGKVLSKKETQDVTEALPKASSPTSFMAESALANVANMPSGAIPPKKETGKVQPKKATQDVAGSQSKTSSSTSSAAIEIPNIPSKPGMPNMPLGAEPPKKETGKVQPKKETVRISLPPKPSAAPTIKLPTLPPGGPAAASGIKAGGIGGAPAAAPTALRSSATAPAAPKVASAPAAAAKRSLAPAMTVRSSGLDTALAILSLAASIAMIVSAVMVYLA